MKRLIASLTAPSPAASAAATLRRDLDAAREHVAAARAEVARIENAPRPVAEALVTVDAFLDRLASSALDNMPLGRALHPGPEALALSPVARPSDRAPDATPIAVTAAGLAVLVGRDTIRKAIKEQLDDMVLDRETIAAEDRADRLADAQRALVAAEAHEEQTCRSLEAVGLPVARRPDLNPMVALADDASLARLAGDARTEPGARLGRVHR